ncbi:hypothetical protein Pmani_001649 [Petrolisthes manimaculis]|uniref:Protein SERAC1 n=1 Tax=Petrolisthes manimaculis TaxID=1843537 RepID=A0AAE1QK08_9EUCA|nr:hypothetical protein Pmani_001649 [Petrolisthes manimaculis]
MISRLPHTVLTKFGVAATFIVGAVVGTRVRRHKEVVSHTVEKGNGNTLARDKEEIKKLARQEKHKKIISKIYRNLHAISSATSTTTTTAALTTDQSVLNFYTELGKTECEQYLAVRGHLPGGWEVVMKDWLTTADDWMAAGELWTPPTSLNNFKSSMYSEAVLAGVRALWYRSKESSFIVTPELLQTLCEVVEENSTKVKALVLKTIANISMWEENHNLLHDAGVKSILTGCACSEESLIFLPAWRALHNWNSNGDTSFPGERTIYPEGVYPYIMPGDSREAEVDIVLVHGIRGGAEWTFRQHDSATTKPSLTQHIRSLVLTGDSDTSVVDQHYSWCWPLDWLDPSLHVPTRVLAVSYESGWQGGEGQCSRESCRTIAELSKELHIALRMAGVGQRPIVWIGHSMGGLIIKHMMSECEGELGKQSAAVVFLSVPHHGSPLATIATSGILSVLLCPTNEVCEMRIDNPELTTLHQSFLQLVQEQNVAVLTLNETKPTLHRPTGYDVLFVPSQFGDPGVGEFCEVNATHLDICKPLDRNAEVYQRIFTFLQEVLKKIFS